MFLYLFYVYLHLFCVPVPVLCVLGLVLCSCTVHVMCSWDCSRCSCTCSVFSCTWSMCSCTFSLCSCVCSMCFCACSICSHFVCYGTWSVSYVRTTCGYSHRCAYVSRQNIDRCCCPGVEDINYSRYPDVELQRDWLTAYLESYKHSSGLEVRVTDAEVTQLYFQVCKFSLVGSLLIEKLDWSVFFKIFSWTKEQSGSSTWMEPPALLILCNVFNFI